MWEGKVVIAIDEKPKHGTELARLRNIHRDPRVSLLVDDYSDDWEQLAWVRLDGTAAIVPRADELPGALAELRKRYPQYRQMNLEARPMIVISPARVVEWRWTAGGARDPSQRKR
jgi:PPOX class probable F420-dependent enzyme